MPELPEVETVRKQLAQEIVESEIVAMEVRDGRCYTGLAWKGKEMVVAVERVGKYIFVKFESGRGMQIHLKMTGRLIINKLTSQQTTVSTELDYDKAKHTRVVMTLQDGRKIFYWDTRMFGYIQVVADIVAEHAKIKEKLGPEPWDITDSELLRKFKKTGRSVKEVILDQSILAGVGNIYANDGLWLAGIDPRRKAKSLTLREVKKLRASLCKVLSRGLSTGGASDNSYVNAYGEKGSYQDEFLTYRRNGQPCHKCGKPLKRIVVGGRGTWVCEKCQS